MADEQKPKRELKNLELNRETIQDLTGEEAEAAHGGGAPPSPADQREAIKLLAS